MFFYSNFSTLDYIIIKGVFGLCMSIWFWVCHMHLWMWLLNHINIIITTKLKHLWSSSIEWIMGHIDQWYWVDYGSYRSMIVPKVHYLGFNNVSFLLDMYSFNNVRAQVPYNYRSVCFLFIFLWTTIEVCWICPIPSFISLMPIYQGVDLSQLRSESHVPVESLVFPYTNVQCSKENPIAVIHACHFTKVCPLTFRKFWFSSF